MARLVEALNPPEDILRQEGFGISPEGVAVAPEVVVKFPRLVEAELPEDLVPPVQYSGGAEGLRALGSGLTLGNIDELEAGLRAPFSDEDYTTIRDRLRAQQAQFGQDYPVTQTALDIVGGLALPAGVAGTAIKAGKGLLGSAKAGAAAGGVAGGITGVGVAPEISDIPSSAATFAVTGAGLGAAAPVAFKVAGNAVRNLVDGLGFTNANKVASRKLQEYFDRDDLTPSQVNDMLKEYRRLGLPDPVIADISDNLRAAGYSAQIVPSKSKTAVDEFLENRQSELSGSIRTGLQEKAGVQSQGRFGFDYVTDLAAAQDAAAKKAYPSAYKKDLPATPFRKYVDRQVFVKAYDEAVKSADVYGEKLPALDQIRNAQFINTEILHKIKRGLDDVIEKETDNITGKMTSYGADVAKIKREFNDLIKYYNKDYAAANIKFADIAKLKSAYQDGLDYMKMETSELKAALKKMTPAERESFRVGMISDISNRLSKFKGGNPIREVFQSDRQKEALRFAFESEGQFNDFVRQLDATKDLLKTFNRIKRTSGTVENLAAVDVDSRIAKTAGDVARGNFGSALMQMLSPVISRARGITPEVSDVMKQRLFNPNPAAQSELLRAMGETPAQNIFNNPATYGSLLGEQAALE
jgi:hypothetical protein